MRYELRPVLPGLLVGSAVFLALFAWRQWYLAKAASRPDNTKCPPLIPLGLISWKNRNLSVIYVGAFLTWGATDVSYSSSCGVNAD